jgi:type VI secretion system protein ImpG
VRPSVSGRNTETWLSFVDASEASAIPPVETVFADLLCSNGRLPTKLAPGELREPTITTPDGVTFRDITRIMPPIPAALDGKTSWQLVSLIAASYLSLADVDTLRALLRLMDFRSVHDSAARQKLEMRLSALESVEVGAHDWLVHGRPVRGRAITIGLRDQRFGGAAEVQLFGSVMDVAFSMFSSINSHTKLSIAARDSGERFEWKPRHGTQMLQ